jgi:hypothetical protein
LSGLEHIELFSALLHLMLPPIDQLVLLCNVFDEWFVTNRLKLFILFARDKLLFGYIDWHELIDVLDLKVSVWLHCVL